MVHLKEENNAFGAFIGNIFNVIGSLGVPGAVVGQDRQEDLHHPRLQRRRILRGHGFLLHRVLQQVWVGGFLFSINSINEIDLFSGIESRIESQ